jgi:hypothetical protein
MADEYVACGIISAGTDDDGDAIEFQPGEMVEGLSGEQMKYLWDVGVIAPADSDRAHAVRVEAGLEEGDLRAPEFGEIFSTESAPVHPVTGAQYGTSHAGTPFSHVESKEVTAGQKTAQDPNQSAVQRGPAPSTTAAATGQKAQSTTKPAAAKSDK